MTIRPRRRRFRIVRVRRMPVVDAERAFDAADDAADRRADHGTDRARDAVAFMETMRGAARDALRLCRHRRREHCEEYASQNCSPFHHFSFVAWSA
jgi:hypothetical protein